MASKQENVNVLENGDIFVVCRPKIGTVELKDPTDVQRLFLLLKTDQSNRFRLIVVPRNKLPAVARHERAWAFVDVVTNSSAHIEKEFEEFEYATKTRGIRKQPGAETIASGRYALVQHGEHTHLVYRLTEPTENNKLLKPLHILPEASFIVLLKKPDNVPEQGEGIPELENMHIPEKLWDRFHQRRFMTGLPPSLLDIEGVQLSLIGAHNNIEEELGIAI